MSGWRVAAMVGGFLSLLLLLIALGSDHWLDANKFNVGLWRDCTDTIVGTVCSYLGMDVAGYIHATRTFVILGMCAGFISCGLLFVLRFRSEVGSHALVKTAMISSHLAGVFALIAMAIFTGQVGRVTFYGWSFILGWICVPLFFLTGGLTRKALTYTEF